jgi:hypothetical protein
MGTLLGIAAAVVLVLIGVAVVAFFRSLAEERARTAERETARLRAMLEEVKEIAWTNREIAPDLATIIIDTIRTREESDRRRQLP